MARAEDAPAKQGAVEGTALVAPAGGVKLPPARQAEGFDDRLAAELSWWAVLPFATLLVCIAIVPLARPHWWEHNRNKAIVAALLALPILAYFLIHFGGDGAHALRDTAQDYVSFILLLGSLFVISGGVYVQGSLSGTPLVNTGILAFGAVLANLVGTTGASMLLIRPLLRANKSRQRKTHIVIFFIFVVSNSGGLLTPLGDPPLFLGFLNGVPFEWTLGLWKEWLTLNCILLILFNIWDQIVFDKEEKERPGSQLEEVMRHEPLRVRGLLNLLFLGGIVLVIFASGKGYFHDSVRWPFGIAESLMALVTLASYYSTPRQIHVDNRFGFGPILEVAILFAGIFITMTPAVLLLKSHGAALGLTQPWHFYWASGALSSFLDNAPTYVTFAAAACGVKGLPPEAHLNALLSPAVVGGAQLLAAISCGSVMMGANSYIGNGPNFMVKAIAEESGLKMPSFFGYMAYSVTILIPCFIIITLLFFR
ncbi:MAG TPA: sodium:proton antiporter [Pirellulales bacterium]|nr:sodium:proton antiporter [Pirellulales bacterium]